MAECPICHNYSLKVNPFGDIKCYSCGAYWDREKECGDCNKPASECRCPITIGMY